MNFMEAIKVMKKGKKVTRKGMIEGGSDWYLCSDGHVIKDNTEDGRKGIIALDHIEGKEWEIYEEKKTLSDKIYVKNGEELSVEDVKEHLKEFILALKKDMHLSFDNVNVIDNKAKEKFGDKIVA